MAILGIGASGRHDGVTRDAVRSVLEATGEPFEYVSLAGKQIGGCRGCVACAADNRCKVSDDWTAIGEMMLVADAIVFGAPNYYGTLNALGHACLERTFCFRHREVFSLAGTLGVAVAVDGRGENSPVLSFIRMVMRSNLMPIVGTVRATGSSQCYDCGFGEECAVGSVVAKHGFLECIKDEHRPLRFAEQDAPAQQAAKVGKTLGSILRERARSC
ncbi:flavodoxin family protein [Candidatus Bipolaricaulota bacterium]|nr:flavodoxin family protein [Candidatus Bipolaricaulota bacterium]